MNLTSGDFADFLSALERVELPLLTWGVVDAALTEEEVTSTILNVIDSRPKLRDCSAREIIEALLDRVLLVRVHGTGRARFRSRFAESVRLLARLRQILLWEDWHAGRPLVADYRVAIRPKMRPKRDLSTDAVIDRLSSADFLPPSREALIRAYIDDANGAMNLAVFQVEATARILASVDRQSTSATVITAGTGSGKTHAFYLAAVAAATEWARVAPQPWMKVLALYPRQELLKDQLVGALRTASRLAGREALHSRPLTVGAWFHLVPNDATELQRQWSRTGSGYQCPYLACPECSTPLVCVAPRNSTALECSACGRSYADTFVTTRRELAAAPPDFLFTTTESLNLQLAQTFRRPLFGLKGDHRPRLCLIDEIHTYDGVHGAHVANLIRRWRQLVGSPLTIVGLSATLVNAEEFMADLTGVDEKEVVRVQSDSSQLEQVSEEYLLALRHNPAAATPPLSTTIQVSMLLPRLLDAPGGQVSQGLYGSKTFVFTDRLDSVNRLYEDVLDAEGWWSPNRPQRRPVLTLASKRAPGTSADDDSSRDRLGQLWALPQRLGHNVAADQQLKMDQTTSQNTGVDARAQLVIATASLEVGYDDDAVGAVIQHQAPHDAARFLQRKGRAGRPNVMRPWMIVVLSDMGRDRYVYQDHHRLFAGELEARRLPYRNLYVLRMQAVYALFDWIALQISNVGDVRQQLSGPAAEDFKHGQRRVAELLDELLWSTDLQSSLRAHLRRAMELTDTEVDSIYWGSPRPLLAAVVPTLRRRLRSNWDWDGQSHRDPTKGYAAPDFAPTRLFAQLLVPEVAIVARAPRRGSWQADPQNEVLGLEQFLSDFAPGNVSKRYSTDHDHAHWVPLPADGSLSVDLTESMQCRIDGVVDTGGRRLDLLRPVSVDLPLVPKSVSSYDRGRFNWSARFEPTSDEAIELPLPPGQPWRAVASELTVHLHRNGAPVTLTRFATDVVATTLDRRKRFTRTISLTSDGHDVAVGFSQEVDAVRLSLADDLGESCQAALRDDAVVRARRWSRIRQTFADADDFAPEINEYERHWLRVALLGAYLERVLHGGSPRDVVETLKRDPAAEVRTVLDSLFERLDETDATGSPQLVGKAHDRLLHYLDEDLNVEALRRKVDLFRAEPNDEWVAWEKTQTAISAGAIFVQAASVLLPDIDSGDLVVDLVLEDGQPVVWISETAPGGTGVLERVTDAYLANPGRFLQTMRRVAHPGDLEGVDEIVGGVVQRALTVGPIRDAFEDVRASWASGHHAVATAVERLLSACRAAGVVISAASRSALAARVLVPGSSSATDALYDHLRRIWLECEAAGGIEVDARVAAYLASEDPSFAYAFGNSSLTRRQLYTRLSSLIWPRGLEVRSSQLDAPNRYDFGRSLDPIIIRRVVSEAIGVPVEGAAHDWRGQTDERLRRTGEAQLRFDVDDRQGMAEAVVSLAVSPTDLDHYLAYPVVESVEPSDDGVLLHVVVRELVR